MKARTFQTNFTGGEISPRAFARVDVRRYANSAARIENMLIGVRGEATRRRGTYFAGTVKVASGRVRLVRFEVSTIAAYVIEFGHLYARFWRNRARVESSPGVPLEIATPYTEAQLRELRFSQSADVLYICHPAHAPRKLSRTSPTAFNLSVITFINGPWQPENSTAVTLTPSAKFGSVTVTASSATFTADDVGRLIALRDDPPIWQAATAYTVGLPVYSYYAGVFRLYRCVTAGTSASADPTTGVEPPFDKNAPNAESDTVRDGTVVWKYIGRGRSAWGWGTITAFGSSTSVTVSVNDGLMALTATTRWKLGEWGGARGWPAAMTFHAGRSVWAGSTARPQTVWTSETGDFESMSPSEPDGAVLDTNAITVTLDDDQVNSVRWLTSFNRGLFIGAPSGEFVINPTNQSAALSPTNLRADRRGDRGSSTTTSGLRAGSALLFASQDGKKLREFIYDFSTDSFRASDLTVLAEHITGKGIVDIARQREPGLIWCCTDDGWLLSLTYDQDEEVRAWSRHMRTVGLPPMEPPPVEEVVIGRTHRWWNNGTPDNAPYGAVGWDTTVENIIGATVGLGFIDAPALSQRARILSQVWFDAGFGDNGKVASYEIRKNGVAVASGSVTLPNGGVVVGPSVSVLIPEFTISVVPGDRITAVTTCSATPAGFVFVGDDPSWTYIRIDWVADA